MAMTASLSPIPEAAFGPAEAHHLLRRASFGASPARVEAAVRRGLDGAVRSLVGYGADGGELPELEVDPDIKRPPTAEEQRLLAEARRTGDESLRERVRREVQRREQLDRQALNGVRRWWLGVMLSGEPPLREKLTLLWHSHFASRSRNVDDAYLMYVQNRFLRQNARDFGALARGIVRDPAMLKFLNNDRNNRRRPNENLSRELMELFTLGEGRYTEADIREGARALTGYHVDDNDFVFRPRAHDGGEKTILGERGELDGDDFVEVLLRERACSEHVALKLYRHFVADVPDRLEACEPERQLYVRRLAEVVRGSGYDLRPALTAMFKSEHFYSPAVVGRMVKSPAQLVVGAHLELGTPERDAEALTQAMRAMGQWLLEPPSVAGWEGGRSWINTSTLFVRQNTTTYLITGKDPRREGWRRDRAGYDAAGFFAGVREKTPEAVVDHAVDGLLGRHVPAERRSPLVAFVRDRESSGKGVSGDGLMALLLLVTSMPEYQLC